MTFSIAKLALKTKIIIGLVILLLFSFGGVFFYIKELQEAKKEKERLELNIKNLNQDIQVYRTQSGDLVHSVNALTVKINELEMFNEGLVDELKQMGLKVKNIQSVTKIDTRYVVEHDTIREEFNPKSIKLNDTKYEYSFNHDKFLKFKTNIILDKINKDSVLISDDGIVINQNLNPKLENFFLELADSLLVVPEYQYKRSWIFWKKLQNIKVHIKSQNPYMKIDKIESYQISK